MYSADDGWQGCLITKIRGEVFRRQFHHLVITSSGEREGKKEKIIMSFSQRYCLYTTLSKTRSRAKRDADETARFFSGHWSILIWEEKEEGRTRKWCRAVLTRFFFTACFAVFMQLHLVFFLIHCMYAHTWYMPVLRVFSSSSSSCHEFKTWIFVCVIYDNLTIDLSLSFPLTTGFLFFSSLRMILSLFLPTTKREVSLLFLFLSKKMFLFPSAHFFRFTMQA